MCHGNDWLINLSVGAFVVNKNRAPNGARFCLLGSGGWIRTSDQLINSQLRYHCATPERAIGVYYSTMRAKKARGERENCLIVRIVRLFGLFGRGDFLIVCRFRRDFKRI